MEHRKFEGVNFWCDKHRKQEDGQGYIVNGQAFCLESYKEKFPGYVEDKNV